MSKIAEQKALEAYPRAYYRNGGGIDDANAKDRAVYEEGYDQAMQDFMDKTEEFLYLQVINNGSIECQNIKRVFDNFKKYIKKEN